ncbi:hypothetical protein JST99_04805 [Candidatus Dependentiae bacterium]|nr:hypothetical protein [Candidatus Dependentiae bacterium]MCC7414629.1 hypothetical protein [Campylobacterota bacterium]
MKLKQLMLPGVILLTSFLPSSAVDANERAEKEVIKIRCSEQAVIIDRTHQTALSLLIELYTKQEELGIEQDADRKKALIAQREDLTAQYGKQRHKFLLFSGLFLKTSSQLENLLNEQIALHEQCEAKNQ